MSLRLCALTVLALVTPPALAAQAPAPVPSPAPAPDRLSFQGEVGFVAIGGNSNVTTYNIGDKVVFRPSRWVFTQSLAILYGRSAGVVNASSVTAGLRGDYGFTSRLSIYGLAKFAHDSFAGIKTRWEGSVGLATKVFDTAYDQFSFELGLGYIEQTPYVPPSRNFVSARTAGTYRHNFTKTAYAQQAVEVLPNLKQGDDYRINSETSIVAPLSSHIALKSSFVIHFDNLPEPGFLPTDRIFTSGLQITL